MMKKKHFSMLVLALVVGLVIIFFKDGKWFSVSNDTIKINSPANGTLSLMTEPDDGIDPVLSLINNASTSVDVVMYELQDKQVESALAADEARGVAVRVLLSAGYNGEQSTSNAKAYTFLAASHVPVHYTESYFALTHEKSIVVDGARALIMTFNLTPQYYSTSRDFGLLDNDKNDVAAMEDTFNDDWQGNTTQGAKSGGNYGDGGDDLVWSPGSKQVMLSIINNAKKSLEVYNEEMADSAVTEALINAAQRGVKVIIVMTYSSQWKAAFQELTTAGADVRTYDEKAPLYIHAKMILADGMIAFVGSENFSENSLNKNRELGLMISDPTIIASLMHTFSDDHAGAVMFLN